MICVEKVEHFLEVAKCGETRTKIDKDHGLNVSERAEAAADGGSTSSTTSRPSSPPNLLSKNFDKHQKGIRLGGQRIVSRRLPGLDAALNRL